MDPRHRLAAIALLALAACDGPPGPSDEPAPAHRVVIAGSADPVTDPIADPVVDIAAGELHTCVVRKLGGVQCWGDNRVGQLGDGTHAQRALPVTVVGVGSAAQVVAGGRGHTCVRRGDGTVACWGDDTDRAVDVPGLAGVVELAAGAEHTCARRGDGTVWCWGDNTYGQLGDGTFAARARPVRVAGLADAIQIAAGDQFSCAVRAAGPLVCWGNDTDGQLAVAHDGAAVVDAQIGIADGAHSSWPIMEKRYLFARPIASPIIADAAAIALGPALGCAIRRTGVVTCWGSGAEGRLGDPQVDAGVRDIPAARGALELAIGGLQVCARLPSTTLCWGGEMYHLPDDGGTGIHTHPPHALAMPSPARHLALGEQHGCAALATGQVACWGENSIDQLGTGMIVNSDLASIDPARGASQLASGYESACALRDGRAQCWTYGSSGRIEVGDAGIAGAVQLARGMHHSCAVLASHRVTCWGDPFMGGLGDGSDAPADQPILVAGVDNAVEVAASATHSCVRRATGAVACWGNNADDTLGVGSGRADDNGNILQLLAAPVAGLANAVELATGSSFTCARRADRTVWCWGDNESGQLGDGTKRTRHHPTRVLGLAGIDQITAGGAHACARSAGTVWCWGNNESGQLGDGTFTSRTQPVQVAGLADAIAISAGDSDHTCAVRATGAVVCWGENLAFQLGDGSGPSHPSPQDVVGIADAVAVATGGVESCALRRTGEVTCWSVVWPNQHPPVLSSDEPRLVALPM